MAEFVWFLWQTSANLGSLSTKNFEYSSKNVHRSSKCLTVRKKFIQIFIHVTTLEHLRIKKKDVRVYQVGKLVSNPLRVAARV